MSTATTTPVRLMRCPVCGNHIYATVTCKLDFGRPRPVMEPSIETTVEVTAKVSGVDISHDCRDGRPVPAYLADAEVAK